MNYNLKGTIINSSAVFCSNGTHRLVLDIKYAESAVGNNTFCSAFTQKKVFYAKVQIFCEEAGYVEAFNYAVENGKPDNEFGTRYKNGLNGLCVGCKIHHKQGPHGSYNYDTFFVAEDEEDSFLVYGKEFPEGEKPFFNKDGIPEGREKHYGGAYIENV